MITVAEASAQLGISASTIRLYEKQFELNFARSKGGQRLLTERDVENLRIIRSFRNQNVPVDEIRRQLTLPETEIQEGRPAVEDVIGALVARQDELERIIKAQQSLIQQIMADNQKLLVAQEQVQLLLEGPKQPDPLVLELAEQVKELESQQAERESLRAERESEQEREIRALQARLEALGQEVEALPAAPDADLDALQSRLAELESELRERPATEAEDPALGALRDRLAELEEALSARARAAEADQLKGMQRRLLDLETAIATREESHDEEGLLETLVTAIQDDARRRRPWWKFWG